jgi:RNA polymerase sigma factor (sigma-70 family)
VVPVEPFGKRERDRADEQLAVPGGAQQDHRQVPPQDAAPPRPARYDDAEGAFLLKEMLLADPADPETEYFREVFWQALFAALEELPENQRQVFVWNELEEMTLQEIADKTGQNLKTIISRKGYAVKHLRKRLEALYRDYFSY